MTHTFGFVDRLAAGTEVEVMHDYLTSRWERLHLPREKGVVAYLAKVRSEVGG